MSLAWLASYPKSGNTWTRILLASYLRDAQVQVRMTTGLGSVDDAVPDLVTVLREGRMLPVDDPNPLFVKTHFLPGMEIHSPYRSAATKVIYLVRNPRDVIPSAERMLHISPEYRMEYARHFIANRGFEPWRRMGFGSWPQSVLEWTEPERLRRYFPHAEVCVMRYEDMKRDTVGALHRLVDFLGLDDTADPDRVKRAVHNSALDKLRDAERSDGKRDARLNPFFGQGLSGQSLAAYGADIEEEYQRLLSEDDEFAALADQYGYAKPTADQGE